MFFSACLGAYICFWMCDSYQGAIEGPSFFSLGLSALCFIICCLFLNQQGQRAHKYSCPPSHLSLMLIEKTQQPKHHQVHFLFFVCMWGKGSSSLFHFCSSEQFVVSVFDDGYTGTMLYIHQCRVQWKQWLSMKTIQYTVEVFKKPFFFAHAQLLHFFQLIN